MRIGVRRACRFAFGAEGGSEDGEDAPDEPDHSQGSEPADDDN